MESGRADQFAALITVNHDDLFRYIYSLAPNYEDANDILQETALAICGKFDEYDAARPFLPWACGFAYRMVLQHRDRNLGRLRCFAAEVLQSLARRREAGAHVLQARLAALDGCIEKLPDVDRRLLHERYTQRVPIEELAPRVKQSRRTLLRNLKRIRGWLHDCVQRNSLLVDEP